VVAEIGVWEPLGPPSGVVDTFAAAPADARRLYAVQAVDLVLRSDDGGLGWSPILDVESSGVAELAVAPSDPDVLYVGLSNRSILRSRDGGATWEKRAPVPDPIYPVTALTVDPSDPDHVLVNGGFDHVLQSSDGAATWSQPTIEGTIPYAIAFAFDPVQTSTVYVATSWEYDRSLDGGATWSQVGEAGHVIYDLVAHPSQAGVLFAATDIGIERSADGGETWSRLGNEAGPGFCQQVAVAPWDGDELRAPCNGRLWRSSDGGATWGTDPTPLVDAYAQRIEAVGEAPGTFYLSTYPGIVASFDGGATWTLRTPRLGRATSGRLLTPPRARSHVFLGTGEGLFVSDPPWGGWSFVEALGATFVYDLAAERHGSRIYAASDRALLASDDGGGAWTDIAPGMDVRWLTVDPLHRGTLYAWDRSFGLFRTTDGGETWAPRGRYVRDCLTSIEAHPSAEDTYFGTATCCSRDTRWPCGGVLVTRDGWATQRRIFEGYATAVALRPPKTLFVGTEDGVYRSANLGKTWTLVSDEIETGTVRDVLIDPGDPQVVYAGISHFGPSGTIDLIRSEDGGETWAAYDDGLPDDGVTHLAIDPRRPWFLYATLAQHGVWRLQLHEIPLPDGPGGRPLGAQ
jgi:photosystem II stability/assembly factor-like uncharacterized protein